METNEQKQDERIILKVNYYKSGVKTLQTMETICYILAVLMALAGIIAAASASNDNYFGGHEWTWSFFIYGVGSGLIFFIIGAICKVISELGRNALIQRAIIQREYKIYYETENTFFDDDK